MKSYQFKTIFAVLVALMFSACSSQIVLPPLPSQVTSSGSDTKFYVKPIVITDSRMSVEMREGARAIFQSLVFDKLTSKNKLAANKEDAKYELEIIVEKYYKRSAEGYLSPFGSGPKSDHMETLVIVKDIHGGEELGRGRIFYRDPSVFGSLQRMIEDSAQEILNYVTGQRS